MPNNNELTTKEKLWAKNLKAIWDDKKNTLGLTQEKAAEMYGCTQANISQYLLGKIPLNTDAISKFSAILQVEPTEINPESTGAFPEITTAKDLLPFVKRLSGKERTKLMGIMEVMTDDEPSNPSS